MYVAIDPLLQGTILVTGNKSVDLLSAPSSLKSLQLHTSGDNLPLHALHLKNNTNLTRLQLLSTNCRNSAAMINIVNHNRILEELRLGMFMVKDIDAVRCLVGAIRENSSLQRIELWINDVECAGVTDYMITHHEELTHDHRIEYNIF